VFDGSAGSRMIVEHWMMAYIGSGLEQCKTGGVWDMWSVCALE
jgi:hypothetical protein